MDVAREIAKDNNQTLVEKSKAELASSNMLLAKYNNQTFVIEKLKAELASSNALLAKYNNQPLVEKSKAELAASNALLAESAHSCPVLFAKPGDLFWHPTAEHHSRQEWPADVFRFEGYVPPLCNSEGGRFVFEWMEGGNGIDCRNYGALNGGVRDLMGAFPTSHYVDPDDPENADRISLPAQMIWGFRIWCEEEWEEEEEEEEE